MEYRVFAPASVGNVGPGFDCLGLCLEGLGDTLTGRPAAATCIKEVTGKQADGVPYEADKNAASIAAEALFAAAGYKGGVEISIHRNLPLSGGLGASAASAVGGALLAAALCGIEKEDPRVIAAALEGETRVAGRHLDNVAPCLYGGLTLVRDLDPIDVVQVPSKASWWVSVLSPFMCLDTKKARTVLPPTLATQDWVAQLANTASLVQSFMTADVSLFQRSLQDGFAEPKRAPLIKDFYKVQKAALEASAMGCTISGGGPSIFAISETKEKAHQVGDAMQLANQEASLHVGPICYKGAYLL